jgi:hypothetical protein
VSGSPAGPRAGFGFGFFKLLWCAGVADGHADCSLWRPLLQVARRNACGD